jgi:hypothetical protein
MKDFDIEKLIPIFVAICLFLTMIGLIIIIGGLLYHTVNKFLW